MPTMSQLKDDSPLWVKATANGVTRAYGLATVAMRPVPDFLVVGTKRGGTTSLFNYLLMHPGVLGLFPQTRGKKSTDYFYKEMERGSRWYRSHFHTHPYRAVLERRLGYAPVGGESSPYYMWDPRIAERVQALAPEVKAVALLRDPVERAWSHYQERRLNGVEPLSFEDALAAEADRTEGELARMMAEPDYYSEAFDWYTYRARGIYLPSLVTWCSVFPRDHLLVLRSEDMYGNVQAVFDSVCDFLGLPRWLLPNAIVFNASPRSRMPDRQRGELEKFYAAHNRSLEAFLGRSMAWSS